jgi:hypothetical protein
MAMTKAEKAELEKARHELALVKALRFSGMIEPELMPKPTGSDLVEGWTMNEHGDGRVEICTTAAYTHWRGADLATVTSSQGKDLYRLGGSQSGRTLYRCKADALRALRLAKELEFSGALAFIDQRIAEAEQE